MAEILEHTDRYGNTWRFKVDGNEFAYDAVKRLLSSVHCIGNIQSLRAGYYREYDTNQQFNAVLEYVVLSALSDCKTLPVTVDDTPVQPPQTPVGLLFETDSLIEELKPKYYWEDD